MNPGAMDKTSFEAQLKATAMNMRQALLAAFAAVGTTAESPRGLARDLKIDKSLTWKILKLIQEMEPAAAITHLPGPSGIQIFLKALEGAGAKREHIEAIERAAAEFDRLISVHSGDRATLDVMLDHMTDKGLEQRLEVHRKNLFKASSAVWGVHTKLHLLAQFVAPAAARADFVDLAHVRAFVDFRRLRQNVPWLMGGALKCTDEGATLDHPTLEPIDHRFGGPEAVPLIADFCSDPPPDLRLVHTGGRSKYELVEGAIGNAAAVTCTTGWLSRNFATRYRTEEDRYGAHFIRLDTPTELFVQDLFVHRDCEFAMSPQPELYSILTDSDITPMVAREGTQLPFCETVTELGWGASVAALLEMPNYVDLLQSVFDRAGWTATDFCGFRFKMRYPPISAVSLMRYDLPERPVH